MATVQPDHDLTRKRVQILHSCTRVCFLRRVRVRGTWKCARIWRDEDNDKSNLGHKRRPLGRPKTLRASQRLTYTVSAAAEKFALLGIPTPPVHPGPVGNSSEGVVKCRKELVRIRTITV